MRRPGPLTTLGLAAALLTAGCAEAQTTEVPAATADCGPVEFPALQFGSHLLGDAEPPVPYSSVPPSSGWHASGAPPIGVFDRPLSEPEQVLALEAGGVVVTHNAIDDASLDALRSLATDDFPDRLVVTPYSDIPAGTLVFTSWGAQQRCDALDTAALQRYVAAYATDMTTFEEPTTN